MDITEKVLEIMRAEGQPLNAGKIIELALPFTHKIQLNF